MSEPVGKVDALAGGVADSGSSSASCQSDMELSNGVPVKEGKDPTKTARKLVLLSPSLVCWVLTVIVLTVLDSSKSVPFKLSYCSMGLVVLNMR